MLIFGVEIVLIFAIYYYSLLLLLLLDLIHLPEALEIKMAYKYCKINKQMNTCNPLLKAIVGIKMFVAKQGGY